jgi:hypothetical protein
MLVHMTPGEVAGLQALAIKHGGELTINPDTGLPEANFLKKLLPTLIGAGLSFIPGVGPLMAAGIVGGVETIRTGDIGRGLSAGLGAYGGAGLAQGIAGAGAGAMGANASNAAQVAGEAAAAEAGRIGLEQGLTGPALDALKRQAIDDIGASTIGKEAIGASFADKLSAGAGAVTKDPASAGAFLKGNAKNLMYAAGPAIMAGANVRDKLPQTVTRPGMIRPFSYDPYGGTYTAYDPYEAAPTRAAGGGLMGMADGGYSPGNLDFAERSEPVVRMASGGIAGYAQGGNLVLPEGWGVAGGKYDDPNEKISYFNQQGITPEQLLGSGKGVTQADIDWMQTTGGYNVPNPVAQVSNAPATSKLVLPEGWGTAGGAYDTAAEKIGYFNQNNIMPEQLLSSGQGVTQADIDWMRTQGRYAPDIGTYLSANPNLTYTDINSLVTQLGLTPEQAKASMQKAGLSGAVQYAAFNPDIGAASNVEETYGGLKGLSSNINYWLQTHPGASLNDFRNEMSKWLLDENDIKRATGKTSTELFTGPITTVYNPAEGASGATGAAVEGGGTVVNPNGTITTSPRIPGIPVGGFTGMKDVRDAYTAGGGSLGYTPYVPTSIADFEERYDRQTGGSRQAYDFLMGKAKYSATPYTETGEIQKPYWESVGRMPANISTKKYLFENGKYVENPDYVPPSTFNSKGEKVTGVSTREVLKGFDALKPAETQANFDYVSYLKNVPGVQAELDAGVANFGTKDDPAAAAYNHYIRYGKNEGQKFPTLSTAKPDDKTIFEWADTNNVSDAQLASRMGISVAEVARRRKAVKQPATVVDNTPTAGANGGLMGMAAGGYAVGGLTALARGGASSQYNLGDYSDGGRLLRGPGDGVSDSIPASIGNKRPARLADGEFVVPARIVSELGNGSTEAGARKLYAMMDRVQKARRKTTGKTRVATNTRADKHLPA